MDVFDLYAALKLDKSEYDKGLDDAKGSVGKFGSIVSSTLGTAAGVGIAAITAAAAGVTALTAKAVNSYATYEQMVGGIETLFGAQGKSLEQYAADAGKSVDAVKDEYNTLMEAQTLALDNANNAYKTAGMSANEYMGTITSFAAALKQSTADEVEAAQVANTAVQDMSDNANKMGTNMQSIQDAYQGFAKQNYTMLDNLKLGYGGTKEEMQRLLADAEKISGIHYDISNLSDVYNAVHVIQQELGITGTTAKEAMYTIEGSANMTKAAWGNVITAIGKGEGLTEAFSGLSTAIFGDESGGGLLNNIIPRIQTTMESIGDFIVMSAPLISEKLPELVGAILPPLLEAATSLLVSLASALPDLLGVVWSSVIDAIQMLYEYLLAEGPNLLSTAQSFINNFLVAIQNNLPNVLSYGVDMVSNLANGIISSLPYVISSAGNLISSFLNYILSSLPTIMQKGFEMAGNIANGILNNLPAIVSAIVNVITGLLATIASNLPSILQKGIEMIGELAAGLIQGIPKVIAAIPGIISGIVDSFINYDWLSLGVNIIKGIASGISSAVGSIVDAVKNVASDALDSAKDFLGIHSPSRVFRDQVGKMISLGLGVGMEDNAPVDQAINMVKSVVDKAKSVASNLPIPITSDVDVSASNVSGFTSRVSDSSPYGVADYIVDAVDREFTRLIKLLTQYFPQFTNMQIVLDTGALVGEITPGIDDRLGRISEYKGRGN